MKKTGINKTLRWAATLLCAITLLCSALPMSASAWNEGEPIRVGFFAMDGYHMQDDSGARSGLGYEFLQLVAQYSNLRFEYVGYDKSWDEMQEMLENGEIDLLTSAQETPEREKKFDFSSNLIGTSTAILTVKAGDSRFDDGDYEGMRVGLIKGNSRNEQLAELMAERGFSYTPVYYYDMNELTQALQDGNEIDAAMSSDLRWTEN